MSSLPSSGIRDFQPLTDRLACFSTSTRSWSPLRISSSKKFELEKIIKAWRSNHKSKTAPTKQNPHLPNRHQATKGYLAHLLA
mmetsp:Transcript_16670/g.30187  ORF Transcript_16670/g.30187 Transcript_16670/m.30187 type:complete len:83 (-) Transcript_16670:1853-2101(-)